MIVRLLLPIALMMPFVAGCGESSSGPNPQVEMTTNMGKVRIELFQDKAPVSVKNFLGYVDDKHYDGLIFHRVIPDFMIQGGGFKPEMAIEEPTRRPIDNESGNGLSNARGTLAMARTNKPHSATSQFYVNVVDNGSKLDRRSAGDGWGYAVFGKVIDGMDVVDKIRRVPTGSKNGHDDVPREPVVIESIRRIEK